MNIQAINFTTRVTIFQPSHNKMIKNGHKISLQPYADNEDCVYVRSCPEVIKLFFMLNSTEHESSTAHKN